MLAKLETVAEIAKPDTEAIETAPPPAWLTENLKERDEALANAHQSLVSVLQAVVEKRQETTHERNMRFLHQEADREQQIENPPTWKPAQSPNAESDEKCLEISPEGIRTPPGYNPSPGSLNEAFVEAERQGENEGAEKEAQGFVIPSSHLPRKVEKVENGEGEKGVWGKISVLQPLPGSKPKEFHSPHGFVFIKAWKEVLPLVVRWLMDNHKLHPADCPIPQGPDNKKRCLVAKLPRHPDNRAFGSPVSVRGLWVETLYGAPDTAKHARWLMEHLGADPSKLEV